METRTAGTLPSPTEEAIRILRNISPRSRREMEAGLQPGIAIRLNAALHLEGRHDLTRPPVGAPDHSRIAQDVIAFVRETDHSRSAATQPYRTTPAAQQAARRCTALDPAYSCTKAADHKGAHLAEQTDQALQLTTYPETGRRLIVTGPDRDTLIAISYADGETGYRSPYRCVSCKTPQASQLEADLCCPANELTQAEAITALAQELGRRLGGI